MFVTNDTLGIHAKEKRTHRQLRNAPNRQRNGNVYRLKQRITYDKPIRGKISTSLRMYTSSLTSILEQLDILFKNIVPEKNFFHANYYTFNDLYVIVEELRTLLSTKNTMHLADTSQVIYELLVNLSYLQDSLPRLLAQIGALEVFPSTRLGQRHSREMAYQLQEIIKAGYQIQLALTTLVDEPFLLLNVEE